MENSKQAAKWIKQPGVGGNSVLIGDGFYVSFNPSPPDLGLGFGSDDGGPETALVHKGQFHILNGDFRKQYEALAAEGFDVCYEFFRKQNNVSSWSGK